MGAIFDPSLPIPSYEDSIDCERLIPSEDPLAGYDVHNSPSKYLEHSRRFSQGWKNGFQLRENSPSPVFKEPETLDQRLVRNCAYEIGLISRIILIEQRMNRSTQQVGMPRVAHLDPQPFQQLLVQPMRNTIDASMWAERYREMGEHEAFRKVCGSINRDSLDIPSVSPYAQRYGRMHEIVSRNKDEHRRDAIKRATEYLEHAFAEHPVANRNYS